MIGGECREVCWRGSVHRTSFAASVGEVQIELHAFLIAELDAGVVSFKPIHQEINPEPS
jgi:hypothetical protein